MYCLRSSIMLIPLTHSVSSLSENERRHCHPLAPLYHGYYELVPDLLTETVEFFCNHSYVLSGSAQRMCQPNGTWTGTQPICIKG